MMNQGFRGGALGASVAVFCLVAGGWKYHSAVLAPLQIQERESKDAIAKAKVRNEEAKRDVATAENEEQGAMKIRAELHRLRSSMPPGSPLVALPSLVKSHFARFGIAVQLIRLNHADDEPDTPGFERDYWSICLPVDAAGKNIAKLLLAVPDLERENPFVRISEFSIRPIRKTRARESAP